MSRSGHGRWGLRRGDASAVGNHGAAVGPEGACGDPAAVHLFGATPLSPWSPAQHHVNRRIRNYDRSASVQFVVPVLPEMHAPVHSAPAGPPAEGWGYAEPWQLPDPGDPKTLMQWPVQWTYAMQPKDASIGNLRCRWCKEAMMPGEFLWSPASAMAEAAVLADPTWGTKVDAHGVPIAVKAARARERREQLKRAAEAEAAQSQAAARRRLDMRVLQVEVDREARDDAVNRALVFDN
ncbi:hypothetical protein WJX81_003647 [Elliptochloris bilobata]|uniref:Uncharacterized protein n=1 Tax=Elliptochloris bilobata TaxID=381761 RepID=A0AAW1RG55_9CHLO